MKKGRVIRASALLLLLVFCAAAGGTAVSGMERQSQYRVAMVVKSTQSAFWQSVFAGARAAGTEYNVELTFAGPESEEDYRTQNEMIDQAVADGAQAIVFSAVDFDANAEAVNRAAAAGVRIVVIDSDVNSTAVEIRIGTDNYEAGRMAGRAALAAPDEELYVGVVNFDAKTANGQQREQGFRDALEAEERVAELQTINVRSATEDAREATAAFLRENPEINVIATFNEWTSLGVGWAIRDLGLKDSTCVVAFDSNVVCVGMLERGELDALIVQNPYAMGYLGVEAAFRLLAGAAPAQTEVDTETTLVNRENMFEEEYQKILFGF